MASNDFELVRNEAIANVSGGARRVPADPKHLPTTRKACNQVIGGMWKDFEDKDGVRRPYCLIDPSTDVPSLR